MGFLNKDLRDTAVNECKQAAEISKKEYDATFKDITALQSMKEESVKILKMVGAYCTSISHLPDKLKKEIAEVECNRVNFESEVAELELECKKNDAKYGGGAGAGVLAGAGVAALGPNAAMAIAMTFGTASTGTAISALSGVAATNAALAWLGGGALAAGGAGMAGGSAFLGLLGPAGWVIGGTALVGSGIAASVSNKKIAEKAEAQTREIKEDIYKVKKVHTKVNLEKTEISKLNSGVRDKYNLMLSVNTRDFTKMTSEQINHLTTLINSAKSLSKRINIKIKKED